MAKPTEAQIRALEKIHKQQLVFLFQATQFIINLNRKFAITADSDKLTADQKAAWKKYFDRVSVLLKSWLRRHAELMKTGGVENFNYTFSDFFNTQKRKGIADFIVSIDQEKKGVGFIPLLIWAVIAIVAAVSAAFITDETTTTAQEKADLMKQSQDTAKALNLSPAEALQLTTQTQQQASDGGGGIFNKILLFGGLLAAFYVVKETGILKPKKQAA